MQSERIRSRYLPAEGTCWNNSSIVDKVLWETFEANTLYGSRAFFSSSFSSVKVVAHRLLYRTGLALLCL